MFKHLTKDSKVNIIRETLLYILMLQFDFTAGYAAVYIGLKAYERKFTNGKRVQTERRAL